ncbi:MAG: VOC family protein [Rhodobacterales bacterium]|nr:VOC family protein [Rhodobacterales bacterium]
MMGLPAGTTAVGFILTADRSRSKAFYVDVMGFPITAEDPFGATFNMAGLNVRLTDIEGHVATPHTVLGWTVPDIRAASEDLKSRGISFQIYPGFGQDDLGIWTAPDGAVRVNWFKDPDGNVLSLTQAG